MSTAPPLLEVRDLKVHFPVKHGMFGAAREWVKAVDGVSFDLAAGETLGLVGESGCGKTTLGRALARLVRATAGSIRLDGEDMAQWTGAQLRARRRKWQMIFQDPYNSLDPRMTVGHIIGEALEIHGLAPDARERQAKVRQLLESVGLDGAHAAFYPHEFSGGQRQRIGIARALAVDPKLIICDEPVSALDVSVQAQIINLLQDLQQERGVAYLFVAHDLAVVERISRRVMVMYLGKVVELGPIRRGGAHAAPSLHAGANFGRAGNRCRIATSPHRFVRRIAFAHRSALGLSVSSALSGGRGSVQSRSARPAGDCAWALGGLPFGRRRVFFLILILIVISSYSNLEEDLD